MPAEQKEAYDKFYYTNYMVANVWVNNSRAIDSLYFGDAKIMDANIVSWITITDIKSGEDTDSNSDPERPNAITMWCPQQHYPGLDVAEQCKKGRGEMLSTSFETYETWIREDLARVFGPHGFDPAEDIEGITINRWGHAMVANYPGFSHSSSDNDLTIVQTAKQTFGRIAFAQSDLYGNGDNQGTTQISSQAVKQLKKFF